jgi:hypothetical protein
MKLKKWLVGLGLTLCLPLTALALPIPAAPWDPNDANDELNLYEIYNIMYGTSLTSNTDLEAFAIIPGDYFATLGGSSVDAVAHYAEYGQAIGYFDAGGDSAAVAVVGFGLNATGQLSIPAGTFGLYDQVTGGGNPRWYSDPALNIDSQNHVVAYTGQNNDIFIGFADIAFGNPLVDFDYNDLVLTLSANAIVPEPSSILLVGMGLAGILARRFRK